MTAIAEAKEALRGWIRRLLPDPDEERSDPPPILGVYDEFARLEAMRRRYVRGELYVVTPTEITEEEELDLRAKGLNPPVPSKIEPIPPFPDAWRCRTCRWWENDEEAFEITNKKECLRMTEGENPAVEAYQGVSLWTLPDFGCIQWEAKE